MPGASSAKNDPDRLGGGDINNVVGVLDEEPPWILRKLIPVLSSRVTIDQHVVDTLGDLARSGPLVYALKYRTIYDIHFLKMRFRELGLPVPAFVFELSPYETGSVRRWFGAWRGKILRIFHEKEGATPPEERVLKEVFDGGGAGVLFLVDERTSRARYINPDRDPIRILLDFQGRLAGSISLVPMFILYDRRQRRTIRPFWESFLGDSDQPGLLRRLLIALRKWTVPELLIGEPLYLVGQLEEFGSDRPWEELPFEIRKELVASINARIRVNRGPERLSRTEIKERVLQDPKVQRAVSRAVAKDPGTENKVRKKAESYVDEVAADQRIQVHHFLYYLLKWLFATIFDGIDLKESQFNVLKTKNQEGSLIYVSCHKSHLDYLMIGYLSFINQMAIPYMAAGKNLSFWPVGPLLRNAGAFFIRRTFKGLGLYPHVFAAYLKVLVKEKININFYIEGGRSRTGKLLQPRVGMLAFLIQAVRDGSVHDLAFVPTFIGYDQVPEESSHLRELAGGEKQKESLYSILCSREVLRKRFGRAYIRFDEPISYRAFCRNYGLEQELGPSIGEGNRKLLHDFAYHLMYGIVRAGVVTPVDLVAAGLVSAQRQRVTHEFLSEAVGYFCDALDKEGFELAESLQNREAAIQTTLGLFAVRGFITVEADQTNPAQTAYLISEPKRPNLEFYKNSLVNYVWPGSLLAALLLTENLREPEGFERLREKFSYVKSLMSRELIWDPLVTDDTFFQNAFQFFTERGWIRIDPDGVLEIVNVTATQCFRGVIFDLLALYHAVLVASETVQDKTITHKEFMKHMARIPVDQLPGQELPPGPLLSSVTVDNALTRFSEMGIFDYVQVRKVLEGVADPDQIDQVKRFLGRLLGL